jgi:hypothetical protein
MGLMPSSSNGLGIGLKAFIHKGFRDHAVPFPQRWFSFTRSISTLGSTSHPRGGVVLDIYR